MTLLSQGPQFMSNWFNEKLAEQAHRDREKQNQEESRRRQADA
jgi:hypothetical protein